MNFYRIESLANNDIRCCFVAAASVLEDKAMYLIWKQKCPGCVAP